MKKVVLTLLFCICTLLSSSNLNVEAAEWNMPTTQQWEEIVQQSDPGPIDLENEENGVNQIIKAGIEDPNFAKAIWDAFKAADYSGTEDQTVREILSLYRGDIDASNRGIISIEGIDYLRSVVNINFQSQFDAQTPNKIIDYYPLSLYKIAQKYGLDSSDGNDMKPWFYSMSIEIGGNPVQFYDRYSLGYTVAQGNGKYISQSKKNIYINRNHDRFSVPMEQAEKFYYDERLLSPDKWDMILNGYPKYSLFRKDTTDQTDYTNYKYVINGIEYTGYHEEIIATPLGNGIQSYGSFTAQGKNTTLAIWNELYARIYYPVTVNATTTSSVIVKKVEEGTDIPVSGAVYRLYNIEGEPVDQNDYITDEQGEIHYTSTSLTTGTYYFQEVKAPDGYTLNDEKLTFDVIAGIVNVSGGDTVTSVTEGEEPVPGEVYIDRLSAPLVITEAGSGLQCDKIDVKYEALESGTTETRSFSTLEDAQNFINNNRGSDDIKENLPGIFDGEIQIDVSYSGTENLILNTTDKRKGDFDFIKTDEEGDSLSGAKFVLYEKNTEEDLSGELIPVDSKGDIDSDYINKDKWNCVLKAESGEDGKVSLSGLNSSKTYRLIEYQAAGNFLTPEGQWIIQYDLVSDQFKIVGSVGNPPAFEISDNVWKVRNYMLHDMPVTGGMGTLLFSGIGLTFMSGAAVLFVFLKKKRIC